MQSNMSSGDARVLVIFDYDWSLVNSNSDTYIFEKLYPSLMDRVEAYQQSPAYGWTQLMDDLLHAMAKEKPDITIAEIRKTLGNIPIQEGMLDALRMAVADYGACVKIISDANTFYIESMLELNYLENYVSEIFTNESEVVDDGKRLTVRPFHASRYEKPHSCPYCPSNMCKGMIIDELLEKDNFSKVVYVGDGRGDFCPATRLSSNDIVLARGNDPNGRSFGLLKSINRHSDLVKAEVRVWQSGTDIYNNFRDIFQSPSLTTDCA